jgi:hypothetical protein
MLFVAVMASAQTPPALLSQRAVLDQYCATCHYQQLKTAGLMLDKLDLAQIGDHAEEWEKVMRKLRAGAQDLSRPRGLFAGSPRTKASLIRRRPGF